MENRRRCNICNIDVHRASFVKHERSKKTFREYKTK